MMISKDPLILSFSPRGEGTPESASLQDQFRRPLSPWGERQSEGVFEIINRI
jgi:hypothetical protein